MSDSGQRPLPELDEHGLVRWAPAPPPLGPRTVADVLDPVLATDPGRIALVDDTGELTYAQVDTEVNRVATVLRVQGVRPGDRVAACLPNGAPIIVAFLAVMRLGGIWVGVNRALALPERAVLLRDCGASLLLAEGEWEDTAEARLLRVDDEWRATVAAAPAVRPDVPIDPHAPAGIAYTSGTTGTPKGAVHSQHNMLLPGLAQLSAGNVTADARPGIALPLTILNLQILGPVATFLCGGSCVPLPRIDVLGLVEGVRRHRVTSLAVPPTTAYDLLTRPEISPADIESLTGLGVGGAGAPPGLNERYRERFGRLFGTSYGLTEAPTTVTVERRDDRPEGSSGLALDHLAFAITHPDGSPVPAGDEGEIRVGPRHEGPFADVYCPMLGYWNRPDATRAALTGDGWLRTGDQGQLLPDGSLRVVGRRNDVILRGGANVYPAEVEQALCAHPAVAEAAVIGQPDERLGEVPLAFIRVRDGVELTAEDLIAHCTGRLARYKIPVEIRFVADLPRNAMGKVIKKALASRA
jgi:acyl-CoA synthetase (AMP-forming)/AMP-acid ligase II